MKVSEAKKHVIHHVLETERDEFHREWAPENLKGISLTEAYRISQDHIFIFAVIAIYGIREYKSTVKIRWKEINNSRASMIQTEDDFDRKYTPNQTLKSECFDDESGRFETFGNDLKTVEGHNEKYVWTCIDGDEGMYFISGYHLVNRIYYLITNEPWPDFEEYLIQRYND